MYQEYYSSKHCDICLGDGDGFKCPKCGEVAAAFDASHRMKCPGEGMMQVKCKKCGEAESNCKCK